MDREETTTRTIDHPVDPCAPDQPTIDRVLGGAHHDPHSVLGAHAHPDGTVVRVLRPHADEVHVVREGGEGYPLVKVHDAGLFSGVVPAPPADYRLAVRYGDRVDVVDDPYRWLPTLGEVDLHLIGEGRHERLWDVLGAHVRRYDTPAGPVTGTSFAVWAPTAQGVRVTGDFDGWAGWAHPMRVLGSTGVWELFVPGIEPGTRYKFRVLGRDGRWRDKADPMAFATEVPPATASVVDASHHEWGDAEWMRERDGRQPHARPMSVYEVHLGSWRPGLDYREMARQLVGYLDDTGFTHVELLPVAEHPFGGSWGYQVTSYYAPTSRFGSPDDFRWFVDHLHQHGYGVIVDWVPAHFPRDEWALARFDGSPLYEHADPRRGEQPDWGTLVFDFGRREVRNFLVANALYWLEEFHVDGLRVDAVASMLYLDYSRPEGQWLPNVHGGRENLDAVAFLQEMNATVYRHHPGAITIAEESTAWPGVTRPTHLGGLGFGFKWNMGWMHDTLDYVGRDPVYRGYHHNQMTFSLMYAFSENFVLPISHDEVVHGKGSLWERMPGDEWNKAAGVRALLAFMWAHPGKQLLFQGQEFGQSREWSEERSLDWHELDQPLHSGIKSLVGDLNRAYRAHPALWTNDVAPEGFSWIDANDTAGNVFSFLRHGVDDDGRPVVLACVANFSGTPKPDYRVGLPFAGRWREVLNTDAQSYGGSGWGNYGGVEAEQHVWHGRPASAVLQLPPSGVLWLVPEPFEGAVSRRAAAGAAPASGTDAGPPAAPGGTVVHPSSATTESGEDGAAGGSTGSAAAAVSPGATEPPEPPEPSAEQAAPVEPAAYAEPGEPDASAEQVEPAATGGRPAVAGPGAATEPPSAVEQGGSVGPAASVEPAGPAASTERPAAARPDAAAEQLSAVEPDGSVGARASVEAPPTTGLPGAAERDGSDGATGTRVVEPPGSGLPAAPEASAAAAVVPPAPDPTAEPAEPVELQRSVGADATRSGGVEALGPGLTARVLDGAPAAPVSGSAPQEAPPAPAVTDGLLGEEPGREAGTAPRAPGAVTTAEPDRDVTPPPA